MQYEALKHRGTAVVMERDQVDTDQIMPKQFLTSTERTGYGNHLFDSWRFLDRGEFGMKPEDRQLNPDFELNHPSAKGASILIATTEFGCGSSREHAVWGMLEYGFRAVIAESFGEIFESNARKGGLVPVRLPPDQLAEVMAYVRSTGQAELGGRSRRIRLDRRQQKASDHQSVILLDSAHFYWGRRNRSDPWRSS